MRTLVLTMIFGLLFLGLGYGESLEELAQRLTVGEELTHTFWRGGSPKLLPAVGQEAAIRRQIQELDPTVSVEVLRTYELGTLDMPSTDLFLTMYNILLSVSTMQGIQYYSASRGRMRTLFSESYCVDNPESKRRLHDPEVDEIPSHARTYNVQEDLTFGENIYLSEYFFDGHYIMIRNRNLTTMWYLMLPMVQPDQILTYFLFIPQGNRLIFYGLTSAHTIRFLGLEKTKEDSFYNRLKAIYGWFIQRLQVALE